MSLSRAEKSRQVRSASQLRNVSGDSLKSSIEMVKIAAGKKGDIKNRSRVNEQEVFGALIYEGLGKVNKEAQKSFMDSLGGFIKQVSKVDPKNSVLRGVKRALKKLVDGKVIVKDAARLLRKFALGKSQLDGDKDRVSSKKTKNNGNGTPVRTLENAINKVAKNKKADDVQHFEFKQNNKLEFKNKGKKPKEEVETNLSPEITPPIDFEAEFKVRLENANQIKTLIEGPVQGYNEDSRFDAVREFFEMEANANDGTVTERANEIVSMLLQNNQGADKAMKEYMKDVFDIDIDYQVDDIPNLSKPPASIDEAKEKFEAEFKLREQKASTIKTFIEGPVEGYTNEERGDEVLDFFRSEMNTLDEVASKKASEIYKKFIDASGDTEKMMEVDTLITDYMSNVFEIEINFGA